MNHAAEDFDDLTAMGNELGNLVGDCPFTSCIIRDFYSEAGKNFPDGGVAGDESYADFRSVIADISWDTVAAYRNPPPPPQPILSINWINGGCSNSLFEVTISLPSDSVTGNCNVYSVTASGSILSTLFSSSLPSCIVSNLPDDSYYSAQCSNGVSVGGMSSIEDANVPGCFAGPCSGGWNGW